MGGAAGCGRVVELPGDSDVEEAEVEAGGAESLGASRRTRREEESGATAPAAASPSSSPSPFTADDKARISCAALLFVPLVRRPLGG